MLKLKRKRSNSPSPSKKKLSRSPPPSESASEKQDDEEEAVAKLEVGGEGKSLEGNFNTNPEDLKVKESKLIPPKPVAHDWRHINREHLSLDYTLLYDSKKAAELITRCESEIIYNVGQLAQVRMFGKWIDIPRKQTAFGDPGLTYTFSGNTVPAKPWTPLLNEMREDISRVSGLDFNFVLVNRYQDGNDYMGEHKDDERDLCSDHPIASLSLGQARDFVFRHQDARGKNAKRPDIERVTVPLESGSVLLMKAPTNSFWYHSLPKRPKARQQRLNFTFRKMVLSLCKPVKKDVE